MSLIVEASLDSKLESRDMFKNMWLVQIAKRLVIISCLFLSSGSALVSQKRERSRDDAFRISWIVPVAKTTGSVSVCVVLKVFIPRSEVSFRMFQDQSDGSK